MAGGGRRRHATAGHSRLDPLKAICSVNFEWAFLLFFSRCLFKTPGTLTPECHTGTAVRHSRRGVNVILQILGDLLRAAYNQGGLLPHPHCLASSTTGSLLTTVDQTQGKGKTPQSQLAEQNNETSGVSFFLVIFSFVCFPPGIGVL